MAFTPDRDAVLNALRVVNDPDLRRDIVSLGFIKDLSLDGRPRLVRHRADDAGVSGEGPDARAGDGRRSRGAWRHVGRRSHDGERPLGVGAGDRPSAAARREERHCGRRRKGRRRQDDRRREPRAGARALRQPRRHPRRRHLRPERADHARALSDAAHDRRQADRAGGEARRAGGLDGFSDL